MNLDRLNPDWELAKEHGMATRAGVPKQVGSSKNILVCSCCHEQINKEPLSLLENSKELEFLGFGYPLFYEFLKCCIMLTILSICCYNAISLFLAVKNNYKFCHEASHDDYDDHDGHRLLASSSSEKKCYSVFIEVSRIEGEVSETEMVLRVISFVLQALALVYIRNRIIKLEEYYNERTTSLSDYSIFIKGISKMKGIQEKIRQFFREEFQSRFEIKQMTLLPEYEDIETLFAEKHKIIDKLRPFYEDLSENETELFQNTKKELAQIESEIDKLCLESKRLADSDELMCEKIICVFNTEIEMRAILMEFDEISSETKLKYFGEGNHVYLKQAPEPEEIVWENANIPKRKRILLTLLGWFLSIIVLVVVFVIFYFILEAKSENLANALAVLEDQPFSEEHLEKKNAAIALVYINIFIVVLFDKLLLSTLLHKFTDMERHSTTSKNYLSYSIKLCLGLFFTTAIMTLAVEAIRFSNYYSHPYGVIDEETIFFLLNSFFIPLFWIVNPMRLVKKLKQKIYFGRRSFTQREANKLMEDEHYDMGKRFAEIVEAIWFTYLYSTLLPIGAILTCCGLFLYYWVDKYNLLRRSAVNGQVSGDLINASLTMLDFTLVLKPMGSLIFDTHLRHHQTADIIMLVIAFVFVIAPKDKLIEFFNHEKFRPEPRTYDEVKDSFWQNYHSLHPIYRVIHREKLKTKMIKRGISMSSNLITSEDLLGASIRKLNESQNIEVEAEEEVN